MLGAFGMGAVIGALNISTLRGRLGDEGAIRLCMIVMGVCVAVVAVSRWPVLTGSALVFAGAAWTASVTLFNVGVHLAAPRWVAGRALAGYQAAITGGIALGSWMWGSIRKDVVQVRHDIASLDLDPNIMRSESRLLNRLDAHRLRCVSLPPSSAVLLTHPRPSGLEAHLPRPPISTYFISTYSSTP